MKYIIRGCYVWLWASVLVCAALGQEIGDSIGTGQEAMDGDGGKVGAGSGCAAAMLAMPRKVLQVRDGIIVVVGTKLIKYDTDLEKIAEVTVEVDTVAIRRWLDQTRHLCHPAAAADPTAAPRGGGAQQDETAPPPAERDTFPPPDTGLGMEPDTTGTPDE